MDEATINELVKRVVTLVRSRLLAAAPPQRVLMLFSGASSGYLAGVNTIRMLAEADYPLTVCMTASAAHVIGVDKVREAGAADVILPDQWINTPELIGTVDLVLVPTLSMNTAARLALGLMDSLFSTLVLGALLAGKPVIAVRDGADPYGNGGLVFSETSDGAPALRAQLARHLRTLADYGITLVGDDRFETAVFRQLRTGAAPSAPPPAAVTPDLGGGLFVTQADLLAYEPGSTLRLPPQVRLTPLAQDTIRARRLQLVYAR